MNTIKYTLLFFSLIVMSSCNDDFDLIEEGDTLPVVYGFLNVGSDTQYVRVEKAFAGEDINAYTAAQIEDSVYFKNATVTLVDVESNTRYNLERVDANLYGQEREDGDFLNSPNVAYAIPSSQFNPTAGGEIRLEVDRGEGEPLVTSSTKIIPPVELGGLLTPGDEIGFTYKDKTFTIQVSPDETGLMGMTMYIYIDEIDVLDPSKVEQVVVPWRLFNGKEVDKNRAFQNVKVSGLLFYSALASGLVKDKAVNRQFSHLDIYLEAGGNEIVEFRRIARANSGLTGAQELPLYSNISEGIGIFSSKYDTLYRGFFLSAATRDSLAEIKLLDGYNFVD